MRFLYNPYIWPLLVSSAMTIALGIYAFASRRTAKGAISFILSMLVLTIWSLGNALEMSAADFQTKLFFANVQYFAYCYSPITLLSLCMQFTGFDKWIRNKKIIWLAVLPTIIILLVWTDQYHGLIRFDMHMNYSGSFPVIEKKYGPVFYIHGAYSHLFNIAAWIMLLRAAFFKVTIYRKQAAVLLLGLSLIVIPNILYVLGISPVRRFDITPIAFGPAGLITAWGIFRFKLFDLVPLARATVIETMSAGVMVLDLQDRVIDMNPTFGKIIGKTSSQVDTKNVSEVCSFLPQLAKAFDDKNSLTKEFSVNSSDGVKTFELFLSSLSDKKGTPLGRLAVTYDITAKKEAQQLFLKQQRRLSAINERERIARDMHDNLGQVLGFINLQAQGIQRELINEGVESLAPKLERLVAATQSAHQEIRQYIRYVRTATALEKDFMTALEKDISNFERDTGLQVRLEFPGELTGTELESNTWAGILNIIKEAMNNIRKHAEARQVSLLFILAGERLSVRIVDDGRGFDVNNIKKSSSSGFGLNIMQERAAEMPAELEIESSTGNGTCIALYIPINKKRGNKDEFAVGG